MKTSKKSAVQNPPARNRKKVRLNFEFDEVTVKKFKRLMTETRAASLHEFIRRAASLYEIAWEHTKHKGNKVIFCERNGKETIVRFLF